MKGKDRDGTPIVFYKDKQLTAKQVKALSSQAKTFQQSDIWKLLNDEVRFHAEDRMLWHSKCWEDVFMGKAALYNCKLQENLLKMISEW